MKITVTNQSQSLNEILSDSQKAMIRSVSNGNPTHNLCIHNPTGNDPVYLEIGGLATTTNAMPIAADKTFSFARSDLSDVHLIADTNPTEIYLICSQ